MLLQIQLGMNRISVITCELWSNLLFFDDLMLNGCSYICVWKHNSVFAIKLCFQSWKLVVELSLMAVTTQLWTLLWYTSVYQYIKVAVLGRNKWKASKSNQIKSRYERRWWSITFDCMSEADGCHLYLWFKKQSLPV